MERTGRGPGDMAMRLVRARRSDAAAVATVLAAAQTGRPWAERSPAGAPAEAEVARAIAAGTAVLAAEEDAGAFAAVCAVDSDAGIRWLAVRPDVGRHGLGSGLLGAAEALCRALGHERCRLETWSGHPWLAAWYERVGYARTPPTGGAGCDVAFVKVLAARDVPLRRRCAWAATDPLLAAYHDAEWGLVVEGDRDLFERLILEVFQTGLSWRTVLSKRAALRRGLLAFEPGRLAGATEADLERFLATPGVIRSPRKFQAAVDNARAFVAMADEAGTAQAWIARLGTAEREAALRRRLRYFGPSVAQSFFESVGLVPTPHGDGCPGAIVGEGANAGPV